MSSKKHEMTPADLEKAYEANEIGLKGILGFAIGLFFLIVITFGLMYALLNVFIDNNKATETAGPQNPLRMTDKEKLPPEPRLQSAPGFGVDSEKGRVNLELREPQAEYRELMKQWEVIWKNGKKDAKTGTVTMLPIDEAKAKLLTQNVKAKTGPEAEAILKSSHMFISDASAGRMASETRR
ncbi:MAG: hypothetical protein KA956_11510 [Pyrinomonadaceae bacterium]|nr:hypothetical protein [Acidobacteriota bacterium]MBK7934950.1 hypothetical protein [Acidobacteriota bacterium]MBP7377092.1 hypothetical protein [Pyrinomonadaceae bacterium]